MGGWRVGADGDVGDGEGEMPVGGGGVRSG